MRKTHIVAIGVVVASLAPSSALAWGFAAHQYIMRRAIDLLPPDIKPFFAHFRDEVVVRVKDPDHWRNVGLPGEEDPNHFLDFGVTEYGRYPFTALPREYGAAIEKFGTIALRRNGLLPWHEAEEFGNLRRAFETFKRDSGYFIDNTVLFAAAAAHYIQDAHVPLHATNNFDGQLTGQHGVHVRFESNLFERYQARLAINPAPPKPITNPRDAAFDVLLASYQLVDPLLKADKAAAAGKDTYDDGYFEKFFAGAKPILEQRIADSITATAGIMIGAWEQAGKPILKTENPRPPAEKVRKP
jgi:hypothetical protein